MRGGLYLDPETGRTVVVPRRGGRLEGAGALYVRVPVPLFLAFLLAPLAGVLYVIVVPFVGLAMLGAVLCRKVWAATGAGEALSALFAGAHGRPGWAFLAGGSRPRKGGRAAQRRADGGAAPGDRRGREER